MNWTNVQHIASIRGLLAIMALAAIGRIIQQQHLYILIYGGIWQYEDHYRTPKENLFINEVLYREYPTNK